jgi:mannose PTS system EIIA component
LRPFDILVASHGSLATSLVEAAAMICGTAPGVAAFGLARHDSPESLTAQVEASLGAGRPTLVLTDLYGGTPHNVVSRLARSSGGMVRIIAGANLGLLVEAIISDDPLDDVLVNRLVTLAREGVVDVTARLGE